MRSPLRTGAFVAAALVAAAALVVIARRLVYPFELEFMTGSVLDAIDRVRAGLPVYTPPGIDWIPFLYPPLYYWVGAAVAQVWAGYGACRAVSLAATLVVAGGVWHLARREGATRSWAALGVGLFAAAFVYTGCFYDRERADALFCAMMLSAAVLLGKPECAVRASAAGLLLGLGFFAKQPAIFFLAAAAGGLQLDGKRRHAILLAASGAFVIVGLSLLLDVRSHGFFRYYGVEVPAGHGLEPGLAFGFLGADLGGAFSLVLASGACLGRFVRQLRTRLRGGAVPEHTMLGSFLFAAVIASTTSRLHIGGWVNVLGFWVPFACVALAVLGSRVEAGLRDTPLARPAAAALYGGVILQLGLWAFHPTVLEPGRSGSDAKMASDMAALQGGVKRWEQAGRDVWVVGHGHLTARTHPQIAALADVARLEGRTPPKVLEAIERRELGAIVDDARLPGDSGPVLWPAVMLSDLPDARSALRSRYFVAEALDLEVNPAPAQPRWLFLPRSVELDPKGASLLGVRHDLELGWARARAWLEEAGVRLPAMDGETAAAALARGDFSWLTSSRGP